MTREQIIIEATDINCFYARAMKEHCDFIIMCADRKNNGLLQKLERIKNQYELILSDTVTEGSAFLNKKSREKDKHLTENTQDAEKLFYEQTGIFINLKLTAYQREKFSKAAETPIGRMPMIYGRMREINARAEEITYNFIEIVHAYCQLIKSGKGNILFYPSTLEHLTGEAQSYLGALESIKKEEKPGFDYTLYCDRMREHCELIRGALDPTETRLITAANNLAAASVALFLSSAQGLPDPIAIESQAEKIIEFLSTLLSAALKKTLRTPLPALVIDHVIRESLWF